MKDKPQEINLLERSRDEIENLRRQNGILGAKVNTFDQMMSLFNNQPQSRQGMSHSPDLLGEIKRFLREQEQGATSIFENKKSE